MLNLREEGVHICDPRRNLAHRIRLIDKMKLKNHVHQLICRAPSTQVTSYTKTCCFDFDVRCILHSFISFFLSFFSFFYLYPNSISTVFYMINRKKNRIIFLFYAYPYSHSLAISVGINVMSLIYQYRTPKDQQRVDHKIIIYPNIYGKIIHLQETIAHVTESKLRKPQT